MVAELIQQETTSPLLYEPSWPGDLDVRWAFGWRRRHGVWKRNHAYDAMGARFQMAVARYYLAGLTRAAMADELGFSERQCQSALSGLTWTCYVTPVLAALDRLGISRSRGDWRSAGSPPRAREVIRAQADVLRRCRFLMDGGHVTPMFLSELRSDIRLLAIATEG